MIASPVPTTRRGLRPKQHSRRCSPTCSDNIQAYIRNIALAVIFSLSLVAGNAMAMSMRERTTEVAVLKAIGFSKSRILSMVLGESTMISLLGGLLGIAAGCGFLQMLHGSVRSSFRVSMTRLVGLWLLGLVAVAAGIGLVSGMVPAIRAAQLSVVDGSAAGDLT